MRTHLVVQGVDWHSKHDAAQGCHSRAPCAPDRLLLRGSAMNTEIVAYDICKHTGWAHPPGHGRCRGNRARSAPRTIEAERNTGHVAFSLRVIRWE